MKTMKKIQALLLVLCLAAAVLGGCKPEEGESVPGSESAAESTESAQGGESGEEVIYITSDEIDLRQKVVDYMKEMASIEWTAGFTIDYSTQGNANLIYKQGEKYLGMVYNNNQTGLEQFYDILGEDMIYDGTKASWNESPGNSCATSIRHAWQQISPTVNFSYSADMLPWYEESGVVAIGNLDWSHYDGSNTLISVFNQNSREVLWEAYALMLPGDALVRYIDTGGHAQMITKAPAVVRDKDGNIDPENSYLYFTEQNNLLNTMRDYPSSWKVDYPISFAAVSAGSYLPVSCRELLEGRTEAPAYALSGFAVKDGALKGTLKCNYCMNVITVTVTKDGAEVASAQVIPYSRTANLKTLNGDLKLEELGSGEYELTVTVATGIETKAIQTLTFTK